jgi:hypothetical protein
VDSFLDNLKNQESIEIPLNIRNTFKKFCGVDGFTPSILEPSRIVEQQDRDRYLIRELLEDEKNGLFEWCEKHKESILNVALFKGGLKNGPFADYLICTETPFTCEDSHLPKLSIESKEDILTQAKKQKSYEGRDSGTFNLGSGVSFQMKGSGNTRAQKTCLQFQKTPTKKAG